MTLLTHRLRSGLIGRLRSGIGIAEALTALVLLCLILIEVWYLTDRSTGASLLATGLAALAVIPVVFIRVAPTAAFVFNLVALVPLIALTEPSDFYQWTQLICMVMVAVLVRHWWAWLTLPLSLIAVGFYFQQFPDEAETDATVAAILLLWLAIWLVGRVFGGANERGNLRQERDLSVALAEARQAKLEHEADRRMMAQEVHDILGHSLNVMLVHAGAARGALAKDPAQAEQALTTIESAGRGALDDLDRVLGLLQPVDEAAPLAPQPGLDDLATLVANASGDGLRVELHQAVSADDIPRSQQLALYRVAQEAMTNVVKHADATAVSIDVASDDSMVTIAVTDDGKGLGRSKPGRGRRGMAARAEALGGSFDVEPVPSGGTVVRCSLPVAS